MEISALASSAPESASRATLGGLDSDAFLKLLVAQLKYQNPMDPADGTQMLQQTAQFTQVETLQAIASMQQQLMGFQQLGVAMGTVGKEVTAIDRDGRQITGEVHTVRFTIDGPLLTIDGEEVPLDNLLSITEP